MPQLFQVLRCYKCLAFQVHQTKKSNKYICKICNEKQSIKRHYGIGIAKECRIHVQKLNRMRGEKDEQILEESSEESEELNSSVESCKDICENKGTEPKPSKWSSYLDKEVEETEVDENQNTTELFRYKKHNSKWLSNKKNSRVRRKRHTSKWVHDNKTKMIDSDSENIIDNEKCKHENKTNTFYCKRPITKTEENNCAVTINKIELSEQHTVLDGNGTELQDDNSVTSISKRPKFENPKINKSSKWAQFVEDNEDADEESISEVNKIFTQNTQALFSLCDESDIDDVLDI